MKNKTTIIALICGLALGFTAGHVYHSWHFKYKAFGDKIKYGALSPEYAYAELITSHNQRARDAALKKIVADGMWSHSHIASTLQAEFGKQDITDIPPMAALAMGQFDLRNYIEHPDSRQRGSAVFTSRWWKFGGKEEILQRFLSDADRHVVDQTIYELGYIGDKTALSTLEDPKFNGNAFIAEVRHALKTGEEFR